MQSVHIWSVPSVGCTICLGETRTAGPLATPQTSVRVWPHKRCYCEHKRYCSLTRPRSRSGPTSFECRKPSPMRTHSWRSRRPKSPTVSLKRWSKLGSQSAHAAPGDRAKINTEAEVGTSVDRQAVSGCSCNCQQTHTRRRVTTGRKTGRPSRRAELPVMVISNCLSAPATMNFNKQID